MKMKEWLQTCVKNKPARKQLLRGNGYENEETAANIPLKQACKETIIERGMA